MAQSGCNCSVSTPRALSGPHLASASVLAAPCVEAPRACQPPRRRPTDSGSSCASPHPGTSAPTLAGGLVPRCGRRPRPQKCGAAPAARCPRLNLTAGVRSVFLLSLLVSRVCTCTHVHTHGVQRSVRSECGRKTSKSIRYREKSKRRRKYFRTKAPIFYTNSNFPEVSDQVGRGAGPIPRLHASQHAWDHAPFGNCLLNLNLTLSSMFSSMSALKVALGKLCTFPQINKTYIHKVFTTSSKAIPSESLPQQLSMAQTDK